MSLQAYKKTASQAESPRETEYRLFAQVTRALIAASKVDKSHIAVRIDALDWNRRVWSTLATACADDSNQLSRELRASIVSLSIWVSRYSSDVMRGDGDFEDLIDVNRIIMQGLAPQSMKADPLLSGESEASAS